MALTLDGTLPSMGTGSSMGSGVGLGAVGGGVAGLVLGSLLGSNGNGLFGSGGNGNANAAEFGAINNQIQTLQAQVGANDIRNEMESMENTFATISSGQTSANAANFSNVIASIQGVQTSIASNNLTTLQSINGLGRDITAANTQALINSIQNFNNLGQQVTTASNQIISGQTAMMAQNAQCCCDIKTAIAADGNSTRALINDLNVQNLRDQLNSANNKVSNNEQNQYLLSTLIAHLKPVIV